MRRRPLVPLVATVVVAVSGLLATLLAGYAPVLGLDLQGGASVVLRPTAEVDAEVLDQTIEIIRNRVDALGVAEPDITRQGEDIVVQLPGVADQERALEVVGQTAELRFRPVLQELPPEGATPVDPSAPPAGEPPATPAPVPEAPSTTAPTDPTTTTTVPPPPPAGAEESSLGPPPGPTVVPAQAPAPTPAPPTTTPPTEGEAPATTTPPPPAPEGGPGEQAPPPSLPEIPTTPPEEDVADQQVVLPLRQDGEVVARYLLGPAAATGEIVAGAEPRFQPPDGWSVLVTFTEEGTPRFDEIAAANVGRQLAITLDGEVVSAPVIQQASFQGQATISGDFSEDEARDLAVVLQYGALPVQLEPQTVQTVSATLGRDALQAGVVAGLVGLAGVALFMVAFYRLLGLIALLSLALSAALLWTLISFLGETQGLALSLAGVTGIIVSIGIAVDSNVVYYERVKEEVRSGRSLRSATDRGFSSAFSTILRADFASLIGAAILYFLTVGPVRFFAFFLGVSTILDVVASYFFMQPAATMVVRSRLGRREVLGVPPPDPAPVAAPAGASR